MRTSLRPAVQAAISAHELLKPHFTAAELHSLVQELGDQVRATQRGDLARVEAMLSRQVKSDCESPGRSRLSERSRHWASGGEGASGKRTHPSARPPATAAFHATISVRRT